MSKELSRLLTIALTLNMFAIIAQDAPNFDVTDSDGQSHRLYEDYLDQGATVVVKIFFTNCPPCIAIASQTESTYQSWGAGQNGVEFIEMSTKSYDTDQLVNSYKATHGVTFPSVGSDGGSLIAILPYATNQFGPYFGTPTFVVIGPNRDVQFDVSIQTLDGAIRATGALKPGEEPVDTMDMPIDTTPVDTTDTPIDTIPVDTVQNPVDTTPTSVTLMFSIMHPASGRMLTDAEIVFRSPAGMEIHRSPISAGQGPVEISGIILANSEDVYVTMEKGGPPDNGVSALDLLLIQKHLLGLTPFYEPWKILVSDANLNEQVSAADLVYIKQVLLGLRDDFEPGESWIIVPADADLTSDPGEVRTLLLGDLLSGARRPTFNAYKRGDVNGNAKPDN